MDINEKEFLKRIYENQAIIHKISYAYARSRASRQDLEQEIVLQLWKAFPSFKRQSAFSTWMYRVALNTAITFARRKNFLVFAEELPSIPDHHENDQELADEIRLLYKAIHHLNKIEKAIILMWLDEHSYEEIAHTIGITIKHVSVKLVRIRHKLAEIITKLS